MSDDKTFVRDLYEVTGGKVHQVTENGRRETFVAGDRFHPTKEQLGRGGLRGKVRKVKAGDPPIGATVDVDIGLRTLEWGSQAALRKALDAGLAPQDFEGREPSGATGYVTADVDAVLETKP